MASGAGGARMAAGPTEEVTVLARHITRAGAFIAVMLVASACTPTPERPASTAGASPVAAVSSVDATAGTVHFTDYAINTDGPSSSVVLTGAVGDYGTVEAVKPDGSVDSGHTSQLRLRLARGGFRMDIATLGARLAAAFRSFPVNSRTCSGSVTVRAAVPIVAGSGTGAYARLHGTFELTAVVDEVDRPPCDGTGAFIEQTIIIAGTGAVED